jgi:hypothetical protein
LLIFEPMLKSGFILLLLLFTGLLNCSHVNAQRFVYQKLTLVKDGVSGSIGFVGVAPRIHKIAGKNAFTAGIQLGWYLSDKFLISSTICQTISKVKLPYNYFDIAIVEQHWENRMGVTHIAYVPKTYKLIHPVFGIGLGGGEIKARIADDATYQFYNASNSYYGFVEPYVEAELNISKHFRTSLGATYTHTFFQTNQYSKISNSQLSTPGIYLAFRFGEF